MAAEATEFEQVRRRLAALGKWARDRKLTPEQQAQEDAMQQRAFEREAAGLRPRRPAADTSSRR